MRIGISIDFVIFHLNRNFGIAGRALYLLLHNSVKTFPSALAKMVASFIKVDTIPRLFFLNFEEIKIDESTNTLSFVTPEKSKREAMSKVHRFLHRRE